MLSGPVRERTVRPTLAHCFPWKLFLFLVPVPDRRWDVAGAPWTVVVLALTKKKSENGDFFFCFPSL